MSQHGVEGAGYIQDGDEPVSPCAICYVDNHGILVTQLGGIVSMVVSPLSLKMYAKKVTTMEARAAIPVGLPRSGPTTSYWQDPPADIADLRSTPALPTRADYVIVGAGISGACIARNLLDQRPDARVTLLEAREACSGATGRNGGHTKAASYRSFVEHERHYGTDEAIKIARLELANINATHALAREHQIDCASTPCETVDIIYSQKQLDLGKEAIARMVEMMGSHDPAARYRIWNGDEANQKFLAPNALGAFSYAAGSISAYLFAIGMLRLALTKGLNLQTNTPVTSISSTERDGAVTWTVKTSRGDVSTPNLILATNGYTAHILPEAQGRVVPLQGQVVAQRPGSGLPQSGLPTTYSYIQETGYEYMISRPPGSTNEGDIVIGGGIWRLPDDGSSRFGNTDDTSLNPNITEYLRDSTVSYFGSHWGEDHPDGRIKREWSGVMGATADGLPYVGAVPDRPGLWICAGFNGHGMVWCLKSAEAVVEMMIGDEAANRALDEWFPQAARISHARMTVKFTGGDWMDSPQVNGPCGLDN